MSKEKRIEKLYAAIDALIDLSDVQEVSQSLYNDLVNNVNSPVDKLRRIISSIEDEIEQEQIAMN